MPALTKMTIVINEASIINNNMKGNYTFSPLFSAAINRNNDDCYSISLGVKVNSTIENPFPINLIARVTGIFEFVNEDKETIVRFMKREGFQMVYPYLRSLTTNLTTLALVNPIVLPILDASKIVFTENYNS